MSFGLVRVVGLYLSASFFMTLVFAFANIQASMVLVCAVLGFLLFGSAVGLYAVAARDFSARGPSHRHRRRPCLRSRGRGRRAFPRWISHGPGLGARTYVSILALPVVAAALATFALRPFASDADPS